MKQGDCVVLLHAPYAGVIAAYARPGKGSGAYFTLDNGVESFFEPSEYSVIDAEEEAPPTPLPKESFSGKVRVRSVNQGTPRTEIHTLVSPVDYQERAEQAELEAQAYRAKMHQQARIAKRKQAWINRGIAEGWITPPEKA